MRWVSLFVLLRCEHAEIPAQVLDNPCIIYQLPCPDVQSLLASPDSWALFDETQYWPQLNLTPASQSALQHGCGCLSLVSHPYPASLPLPSHLMLLSVLLWPLPSSDFSYFTHYTLKAKLNLPLQSKHFFFSVEDLWFPFSCLWGVFSKAGKKLPGDLRSWFTLHGEKYRRIVTCLSQRTDIAAGTLSSHPPLWFCTYCVQPVQHISHIGLKENKQEMPIQAIYILLISQKMCHRKDLCHDLYWTLTSLCFCPRIHILSNLRRSPGLVLFFLFFFVVVCFSSLSEIDLLGIVMIQINTS